MLTTAYQYGTLQFGKFEDIQNKGYQAALEILAKWDSEGLLPSALVDGKGTRIGMHGRKGRSARRNSI
jgi:lysophospholipid hydrolase